MGLFKDLKDAWRGITGKKKRTRFISLGKKEGNFGLIMANYNIFEKIEFCLWLIKAGCSEIPYDLIETEKLFDEKR